MAQKMADSRTTGHERCLGQLFFTKSEWAQPIFFGLLSKANQQQKAHVGIFEVKHGNSRHRFGKYKPLQSRTICPCRLHPRVGCRVSRKCFLILVQTKHPESTGSAEHGLCLRMMESEPSSGKTLHLGKVFQLPVRAHSREV